MAGTPNECLQSALEAYRKRGYRIAIASHGRHWQDLHWLLPLKPDVVRFDSELIAKPEQLNLLALRARSYEIRSLIEVDGAAQADTASAAAVDLIQQPCLDEPQMESIVQSRLDRYDTTSAVIN